MDNDPQTILLIYGKFNRFIFWSTIKSESYTDELYEVEINPNGGVLEVPQQVYFFPLNSFITNRMNDVADWPKASEAQQEKIEKEILKDINKFRNSDLGESLSNDIDLDS